MHGTFSPAASGSSPPAHAWPCPLCRQLCSAAPQPVAMSPAPLATTLQQSTQSEPSPPWVLASGAIIRGREAQVSPSANRVCCVQVTWKPVWLPVWCQPPHPMGQHWSEENSCGQCRVCAALCASLVCHKPTPLENDLRIH